MLLLRSPPYCVQAGRARRCSASVPWRGCAPWIRYTLAGRHHGSNFKSFFRPRFLQFLEHQKESNHLLSYVLFVRSPHPHVSAWLNAQKEARERKVFPPEFETLWCHAHFISLVRLFARWKRTNECRSYPLMNDSLRTRCP